MAELFHLKDEAYSIRVDGGARLLDMKLKGFWDVATVERFAHAIALAGQMLKSTGCPPSEQLYLVDNSTLDIQSQEVVRRFEQLLDGGANPSRRTAVVVSSALLKMQARRVGPNHRFFEEREAALRWLESGA